MDANEIRVAVCQLESHPALCTGALLWLSEPFVPRTKQNSLSFLGTRRVPVDKLHYECKEAYMDWQRQRVAQVLSFLEDSDSAPDLLVFPEGAIPFELLPDVQRFAERTGSVVLAGTHSFQKLRDAERVYEGIGVTKKQWKSVRKSQQTQPGVLPIVRAKSTRLFPKQISSVFEMDDVSPLRQLPPTIRSVSLRGGTRILPLICAEALVKYETSAKYEIAAILSYERNPSRFSSAIEREVQNKKAVVYCNDGRYGGSRIVTVIDERMSNWWFDTETGGSLPPGDALLVADINVSALSVEVAVASPAKSSRLVCLASITYENDHATGSAISSELSKVRQCTTAAARKQLLDELAGLTEAQELQTRRLLHLAKLADNGQDTDPWWDALGRDCVIQSIPSLAQLEASLADLCYEELYANLARCDPETAPAFVGFLGDCQEARKKAARPRARAVRETSRPGSEHVVDRDLEARELIAFIDDRTSLACQVSGFESIGKTAVVEKAIAQSGLLSVVRMSLYESTSAAFVLYSLVSRRFPSVKPPYDSIRETCNSQEFHHVLSEIDVLVLERCHNLCSYGVWRDDAMEAFFISLLEAARDEGTKVLLETRRELEIDFADPGAIQRRRISGLSTEHAIALFEKNLRRVGLGVHSVPGRDKEQIVRVLGGHPVALALAADAVYENGVREVSRQIQEGKGFYARYLGRLVNSLHLGREEETVLKLLNGCRMPVPREAIQGACEFAAAPVVRHLISLCVVDVDENGHIETAGILKRYFDFSELPDGLQHALHKNAADEYAALVDRSGGNLEFAVEADYHATLSGQEARLTPELLDSQLAAAESLYDRQEYDKARVIADTLLTARRSRAILRLSALVDARCGSFDGALEKVEESFEKHSADEWILAELGKIALRQRQDDVAERLIKIAKRARVADVSISILEGRWALRRQDIEEAKRCFKRAIERTKYNAWPYFYLGRTLLRDGRVAEAIDVLFEGEQFVYTNRVRSRNVLKVIRTLLAQAYLYADDLVAAEQVILSLVAEHRNDPEVIRVFAAYTLKTKGVADAKKAFEELSTMETKTRYDECQKHLFLGLFYLSTQERGTAVREFSKAHKADKNNVFVMIKWATSLFGIAESTLLEENDAQTANGYAEDCARIVNRILHFSPENAAGRRLQNDLYSRFGIDSGALGA